MGKMATRKSHDSDKDTAHGLSVTGRYQSIPPTPASEFPKTTLAAGAVVWRYAPSAASREEPVAADSVTPGQDVVATDSATPGQDVVATGSPTPGQDVVATDSPPPGQDAATTATRTPRQGSVAPDSITPREPLAGAGPMEVLVIHRPHYDDWSLPKGKVDPGETLPATATREIHEETGYHVRLGKLLGRVTYPVQGRTKAVYYWTARCEDGEFTPNNEVDEIRWLPVEEAQKLVSYDVDREIIAKAAKRFALRPTSRLILVRHAHAHSRQGWGGDDNLRPLDRKGDRQAASLPTMLTGWRATRILTAEPDRCVETARRMADAWSLPLDIDPLLGDNAWIANQAAAQRRFRELIDDGGITVVVSQGLVIPDVIAQLSAEGTLPIDEITCKKAGTWVLTFTDGVLCGADYMASPLPVR